MMTAWRKLTTFLIGYKMVLVILQTSYGLETRFIKKEFHITSDTLLIIHPVTLDTCSYKCAKMLVCLSFTFNRITMGCELSTYKAKRVTNPGLYKYTYAKLSVVTTSTTGKCYIQQFEVYPYQDNLGHPHHCASYTQGIERCQNDDDCTGISINQDTSMCGLLKVSPKEQTQMSIISTSNAVFFLKSVNIRMIPSHTIARGKPASMSTVFASYNGADKGNDGVYIPDSWLLSEETNFAACTKEEMDPFWRVNMMTLYVVYSIKFYNRQGDNNWTPAANAYVTVSMIESELSDVANRCKYVEGELNEESEFIECEQPRLGKFVQFQTKTNIYLNFYEIDVFGISANYSLIY